MSGQNNINKTFYIIIIKMGISVLHPSGFIETGGCSGPRRVRNQPSRETPGVILSEVTDKYVTEFTVPFRNAVRSMKDFKLNWDRLDDGQKTQIMNIVGPFYTRNGKDSEAESKSKDDPKKPEDDPKNESKDSNNGNFLSALNNVLSSTDSSSETHGIYKHFIENWYLYVILCIIILFIAISFK